MPRPAIIAGAAVVIVVAAGLAVRARAPAPRPSAATEIEARPASSAGPENAFAPGGSAGSLEAPKTKAGPSVGSGAPLDPTSANGAGPNPAEPALERVRAAKKDPSAAGTAALIATLSSEDSLLVVEAADGLVARRATEAIRPLAKVDIRKNADIAPAVIDSLGKLGGLAGPDEKEAAVTRLTALLAQEKTRGARESLGNLLQIYEALGDTKHPKAAPPLEAELRDAAVARAAKNVCVQALGRIGAASSRAALTALQAENSAVERDSFEEQLRIELLAAIDTALRALP